MICGITDPSMDQFFDAEGPDRHDRQYHEYPINGCGGKFRWSDALPYQKLNGMDATRSEMSLTEIRLQFLQQVDQNAGT